jgi:hypothetical protein
MKKSYLILFVVLLGLCTLAPMAVPTRAEAGPLINVLMYIPNRVFDAMDMVRLRLRVGPGISAGVRATRPVSGYLGMHTTFYVGLPGPRGRKKIPWPIGGDVGVGAQASIADLSERTTYYDPLEVGAEAQILLFGANVGVGVFEIVDFIAGFAFIDLAGDDIGYGEKEKDEKSSQDGAAEPKETPQAEEAVENP